MNALTAGTVIVALVVAATLIGVLWRARTGRVRNASGRVVTSEALKTGTPLGAAATIVQFSTEFCGPCRVAERVLTSLAAQREGVAYLDIDLGANPDVATEFGVLQTPTILLLDAAGGIRSRIGGVPRPQEVTARLDEIVEESHVVG